MTRGGTPTAMPPTATDAMLTADDLVALVRRDDGTRVLTVYLDTAADDPARRHAWRPALSAALREARAPLRDPREIAEFDRAARALEDEALAPGGGRSARGWVAFVTPDGPRFSGDVPLRVPTTVAWRRGPFVSPYLRVLKQQRPTVVVLVDARSARLFRYVWGTLAPLAPAPLATDDRGPTDATTRGPLDPERLRRRQRAHFRRALTSLVARVGEIAGDDAWILVGGTREWARITAASLAAEFPGRTLLSDSLDRDAPGEVVATAARRAASRLRAARGRTRLDQLFERALPHGKGEVGVPATQRALHEQAVDLLFLTPEFLRAHPREAEDAVHEAMAQGAEIEVLSAGAAAYLDDASGGIAARRRFALDGPAFEVAHDPGTRPGVARMAPRAD